MADTPLNEELKNEVIELRKKIVELEIKLAESRQSEEIAKINERKYRLIFENANEGILHCTRKGKVTNANAAVAKILGYENSQDMITNINDISKQLFVNESHCEEILLRVMEKELVTGVETQFMRFDKHQVLVSLNIRGVKHTDGKLNYVEFFVKDIGQIKRTEKALKKQKEYLEALTVQRTAELIKTNKKLTSAIKEIEERTHEMQVLNKLGDMLQSCETEEETYDLVVKVCGQLFKQDSGYLSILDETQKKLKIVSSWGDITSSPIEFHQSQCWAIRRGKLYFVDDSSIEPLCPHVKESIKKGAFLCIPMTAHGNTLGMMHLCIKTDDQNFSEIRKKRIYQSRRMMLVSIVDRYSPCLTNIRLRETLRRQSIIDPLTGVYNRRHLNKYLTETSKSLIKTGSKLGIIMIDIDHFKHFNDTFGHEIGDSILRELGQYLREHTRNEDIVCRYGGEEFTLIMFDATLESTQNRAEMLRQGVNDNIRIKSGTTEHTITISLGVAVLPDHGSTTELVLKKADEALYQAKSQGRNRVMLAVSSF
ncbi:MAG: diguanylate cyclase [Desulfobacterales bacterium]|nr:diguanylate cyclase [Desulfobacterales bacterium]